jgi:hypothetical protein
MKATPSFAAPEGAIGFKEINIPIQRRADCAAISPDRVDDLPAVRSGEADGES